MMIFMDWIRRAWRRLFVPAAIEPPREIALDPVVKPKRSRKRAIPKGAAFYHLGELLDQLPACRKTLRELKSVDVDAYQYHAKVGARVAPPNRAILNLDEIEPEFLRLLPAAGLTFWPSDEEGYSQVIYFQKIKRDSAHIAFPRECDAVYRLTAVISNGRKSLPALRFCVSINAGALAILSEREVERVKIGRDSFARLRWGVPQCIETVFHLVKHPEAATPEQWAGRIFLAAANFFARSSEEFQIRCERGGVSVAFNVSLGRTPYFFKDREKSVTVNGTRRRIFHAVEPHRRTLANGRVVDVTAHYRGERFFSWKGERVAITPPERALINFGMGAIEVPQDAPPPNESTLEMAEVGERIVSHLEGRAA